MSKVNKLSLRFPKFRSPAFRILDCRFLTLAVAVSSVLAMSTWLSAQEEATPAANEIQVESSKDSTNDSTQESTQQNATKDVHQLRPQFPTDELIVKSEKAIQDGLNYLVGSQNEDGSWGSHDPETAALVDFGFQTRHRGSQDAVRTACTAICAEALLNQVERTEEQQAALDKAIVELVQVRKFAYYPGESFNTWGYGYKLGFLVRFADEPEGKEMTEKIKEAAESCVDGLIKYQQHTGGWGYYSGVLNDFGSMSFNTSLFALSLSRAKAMGIDVPDGMVIDSTRTVDRQRSPDASIAYDSRFNAETSGAGVLGNLGSGSRTISSTWALYELGVYSNDDLSHAMTVFETGENYLEMGRKRIQPHSVVHQISGYFFFFGYNYATEAAELLGESITQERWDRFGWTMLRTQEDDGRWWDTAAAEYGDKWGTGFAIQTLQRYVRVTKLRIERDSKSNESKQESSEEPKSENNDG